ncbi:putative flavohemoprotein [Phaeomoniella chlamydospora]|uniref:nitric oxide dioxygenase n=1 Tax=Phaeomoniella chlamydospora TaxID=158046 RepID=A0A0G2EMH5_PHACM|nr:putative flavohemoprotein [Phaeomoniella chlamydospora]
MGLTPEQVQIIKATVPVVKEHGNTITTAFYKNMLEENPELKNIFNTANQANGHQQAALANALYAYASNIDNLGVLSQFVERVCHKHASLYITRTQYDIVGKYLIAAMKQILDDALTSEIQDAWTAAYVQLANIMAGREEQMYQESDGWTTWRPFRIVKKMPESSSITSFYLEPVDGEPLPIFRPGQYISVQMSVPGLKFLQSRQYSLSDRPGLPYYRISVKKEEGLNITSPNAKAHPGYISNVLHKEKKEGDIIEVSHPQGDFFLTPESERATHPIVLISAGVGITPMISILNHLQSSPSQSTRPLHFIHSSRTSTTSLPFLTYLQSSLPSSSSSSQHLTLFLTSSTFSQHHHSTRISLLSTIHLNPENDLFVNNPQTEYFICGPEKFMTEKRDELVKGLGIDEKRIRLELFGTGGVN